MEKELKDRETRIKVLDYILNATFMGALQGAIIGFPFRMIFRSPALGYFIFAYSIGHSLSKANNFLVANIKEN